MGGALESWDGVFPRMSRHLRTLRYDQRGFGWSEKPHQPYTVETLVDDLEAVLEGTRLSPPYHFVTVAAAPCRH
jgi:3-oxoadipate enol-lactonase